MTDPRFATVPIEEYLSLIEQADKLDRLERAGVDNWDGYDDALRDEDREGEE